MTDKERAKRTADAIIALMRGPVKLAPMERLTEQQAEVRHRMVQAQRLK